jgi:hypothetical protein
MRLTLYLLAIFLSADAHAEWRSFNWEYAQITPDRPKERVALTLPAQFDGHSCSVQLDTGMNGAFQWHGEAKGETTQVRFEVAGIVQQFAVDQQHLDQIRQDQCQLVASVGNAFFENGSLTLDLRNARYQFEQAAVLAGAAKAQPLVYAQWYDIGGHLLVEIKLPSGANKYAMLDTGAASFGLSPLSASAWADLVDLPPVAGPGVTEYKVNSWGKQISCFETSRHGPLVIAGLRTLDTFRVSYCQHPDFSTRQKVVGLLGLRDLMDSVITLDYRSLRWSIERPTEDI